MLLDLLFIVWFYMNYGTMQSNGSIAPPSNLNMNAAYAQYQAGGNKPVIAGTVPPRHVRPERGGIQ